MREWIPVPGSVKTRLLTAALARFEAEGFEGASVADIARDAGATSGALHHRFGSKPELFATLREEMERRVRDRMEGAFAAVGGDRAGPHRGRRGDRPPAPATGSTHVASCRTLPRVP